MSTNCTDSTVRELLEKYASLDYGVIGYGVYQIDGYGTHSDWTCIVEACDCAVQVFSYSDIRGIILGRRNHEKRCKGR